MSDILARELETYRAHKPELLTKSLGKYVLIKDKRVVDVFVSMEDAFKRGYDEFGNEPFLVKRVEELETPMNFTSFQIMVH
jgi:hypothetical protein